MKKAAKKNTESPERTVTVRIDSAAAIEGNVVFARSVKDLSGREGFTTELAALPSVGDSFYLEGKGYRKLKSPDYQQSHWQVAKVTHEMRFAFLTDEDFPRNPRTSVEVVLVPVEVPTTRRQVKKS